MLKKIGCLLGVAMMNIASVEAVQVGDVINEYTSEVFSETDRITVSDVEYLYTFKGIQTVQDIVTDVDDNNTNIRLQSKYSDVETQFVIEKAIPLTGNYNIKIDVQKLLGVFVETDGSPKATDNYCWFWVTKDNGEDVDVWTNFYYKAASSIVVGDSCFNDNALIETVSIIPDGTRRYLRIGRRAFYGAVNLKLFEVQDYLLTHSTSDETAEQFKNLQLKTIGESAFEGCVSLGVVGCSCDELERIEKNAFKECSVFLGLVSDFEQLCNVTYYEGADYCSIEKSSYVDGEYVEFQYAWYTPKLKYIGENAFYNAGTEPMSGGYEGADWRWLSFIEWTFCDRNIEIGESAFYSCGFLKEIYFPTNMEKIADYSFKGLLKLDARPPVKLYLPDSLVSIGAYAFEEATVSVAEWPSLLKEIGDYAFGGASRNMRYYINDEQTAVISEIRDKWTNGIPVSLERLGAGTFSGVCAFGAHGVPVWRNGKISGLSYSSSCISSCGAISGTVVYPTNLTYVPNSCFSQNVYLENVILHEAVTNIGSYAFAGCSHLNLVVPSSVCEVGANAGSATKYYSGTVAGVKSVVFEGKPPKGIVNSGFLECSRILVPAEYAAEWSFYMNPRVKLAKKIDGEWVALGGEVISNTMRPSDPTIMDIKYKVTSTKDKVNVRILAFEDGQRSFAKVLRPETFVDGTEVNIGDGVAANVEHTLSWQVSKDWDVDLAKVSVEIYVQEDDLLPLQLTTIPAMGDRAAVTFSRNTPDSAKVMNALYWLYAVKSSDLSLANGILTSGDKQLIKGTALSEANAVSYLYSKMGYGTLSGETLNYVNGMMRSSLSPSGLKQYAVKEAAAE